MPSSTFEVLETYLDAGPLSAAEPERVGKFTLFRPLGPWRFYARPMVGLTEDIVASDVELLRRRQRDLNLPEKIEWVVQTTPSLSDAARESGLSVVEYPLLVREGGGRPDVQPPEGVSIRLIEAGDRDFARAHAVAAVGFGAEGTAVGTEGARERDAHAAEYRPDVLDFMRGRTRDGLSISYAALDETGPIAIGTHQPVGDVTEIVGVATLPAARRRGLAAAVTAALVADAARRGVGTMMLSADSDDVARIYERVGFKRIGLTGAAEATKS